MASSNQIPRERVSRIAVVTYLLLTSIPLAVGGAALAVVTNQDIYRSTTQFMVTPAMFANKDKDELLPLMPTFSVLQGILNSDRVTQSTLDSPHLRSLKVKLLNDPIIDVGKYIDDDGLAGAREKEKAEAREELSIYESIGLFRSYLEDTVQLERVNDVVETQMLLMTMHVDNRDSESCQSIAKSLLESLQSYFRENKVVAISSRITSISSSIEILHSKKMELDARYRRFRRDAPLQWTNDGLALNPHLQEMERIIDRINLQKRDLDHSKLELSVLKSALTNTADGSDTSPEPPSESGEETKLQETPNDLSDDTKARLLANQAIIQWREKRITELNEQVASERTAADRLLQYEGEEKAQLREIKRNDQLLEQLQVEMLKVELLDRSADIKVFELNQPSLGYLNGDGERRMMIGAGIGAALGLLLTLCCVRSLSNESRQKRWSEASIGS